MADCLHTQFNSIRGNLAKGKNDWKTIVSAARLLKDLVSQYSERDEDEGEQPVDPELLREVIDMCLVDLLPAIHKFLRLPPPTAKPEESAEARILDPTRSKKWDKLVGCMKVYLTQILKLMDATAQTTLITKLLRHVLYLIPFYLQYLNLSKNLLKRSMVIWSQGEERNRVLAFLIILRIMRQQNSELIGFIMKKLYISYIKNCKLVSRDTWPMITFMQQSLVELYSLDQGVAYQHAFVFIRQCAISLRNASTSSENDAFKSVTNWQYLQSLLLWTRLLSCVHPSDILKPLIHPLVQVLTGTVKHLPIARYYPLRFHIAKALIKLSLATNTFIPLLPMITEALDSIKYGKKFKKPSQEKELDLDCLTKVSQQIVDHQTFIDACVNKCFELLIEYLAHQSHIIAFPELSFFTLVKIKKFIKNCTFAQHSKMMKKLTDKIKENTKFIEERRKHIKFSLKDSSSINQWQNEIKDKGTPLMKYYIEWSKEMERKREEMEARRKELAANKKRRYADDGDSDDDDNDNDEDDDDDDGGEDYDDAVGSNDESQIEENDDSDDEAADDSASEESEKTPPKKKKRKN